MLVQDFLFLESRKWDQSDEITIPWRDDTKYINIYDEKRTREKKRI